MISKTAITQQLLEKLDPDLRPSVQVAMTQWWRDWRKEHGYRLSAQGRAVFDQLEYQSFEFAIPSEIAVVPKNLLLLDNKLDCPYYLVPGKSCKLVLYSSEQATVFALLNNADRWMQMLSQV